MARAYFFVGLWLMAAPWAQAQRVIAPMPPVPATFKSAATIAAPAAAPFLPAPVPLKVSAVDAAIARFAEIDLQSAPASEVREGADALMSTALGEEIVAASPDSTLATPAAEALALPRSAPEAAKAPGPRVYLMSKPLHETVELGFFARAAHLLTELGFKFAKAALAWQATGSLTAALGVFVIDVGTMPVIVAGQSLADLQLRYWWRKLSTLRRLADTPGVTRIRVLTTGDAQFWGFIARRKENTGLVFLDAQDSLPGTVAGFGAPIRVADLAQKRARLVLRHNGVADAVAWTPALSELLSGAPIPSDVAAAWRARLVADSKGKTFFRRVFDFKTIQDLRVEAHLPDGSGGETSLGTIVFGGSVKRLVGLLKRDRIGALFGRAPAARSIPLSDTTVARGGVKIDGGIARRAWRRLTGALIVRP